MMTSRIYCPLHWPPASIPRRPLFASLSLHLRSWNGILCSVPLVSCPPAPHTPPRRRVSTRQRHGSALDAAGGHERPTSCLDCFPLRATLHCLWLRLLLLLLRLLAMSLHDSRSTICDAPRSRQPECHSSCGRRPGFIWRWPGLQCPLGPHEEPR